MESQESGADQYRGTIASMTQTTQPTAKASIFSLPPEIRREIYLYLLVSGNATIRPRIEPGTNRGMHWKVWAESHKTTKWAILHTCRTIYEEASTVLYGVNTFCFTCRWKYSGECRTFDQLPSNSNFKYIRHLQLDVYRWFNSSCFFPPNISQTLKYLENIGCSLSTLRLYFTPTYRKLLLKGSSRPSTKAEAMKKMADQLCRIRITQKIEIEFTSSPTRKADCERVQEFIDTIAASKSWESIKTTVLCTIWREIDTKAGTPIDLPLVEFASGDIPVSIRMFGMAYGETEEIVMNHRPIHLYKWRWLLQEKP